MTASELEQRIAPAKHLLRYFDQQALASYRNEPHKYVIETDSFEGSLTLTNSYFQELDGADRTDEYLNLRFGYRSLLSGELAIVIWLPDLLDAKAHQNRWIGFILQDPSWTKEADERFSNWAMRTLEGCWEVDNGPKHYLAETINTINGMTDEVVGIPLYKYPIDGALGFPAAENTHKYQDAHKTLYGYLVDGIDKACLAKLAVHAGKTENFDNTSTVASLAKLLPQLEAPSKFADATSRVSAQRRVASHAVRPMAEKFPAFSTFTNDLELCVAGLQELLSALELLLAVSALSAKRRNDAKKWLPRIHEQAHPNASIIGANQMVGRTIQSVEYGEREVWKGVHGSESLIIHFTDGTILGIDTGSNVRNITDRRDDLTAEEIHVDFRLSWVPTLKQSEDT